MLPTKWPRTPLLLARTFQSLVVMLPRAYHSKFVFLLKYFHYLNFFFFFGNARCFGLYFFRINSSTISSSKFMDEVYICLYWLFITKGFWTMVVSLVYINEYPFPFSFFIKCWTCCVFARTNFTLCTSSMLFLWFKYGPSTCKTLSSSLTIWTNFFCLHRPC